MSNQEGTTSIRPPLFNRKNLIFWKTRMRSYRQSLGADVWAIVEGGYQYPAAVQHIQWKERIMKQMQRRSMLYWEV